MPRYWLLVGRTLYITTRLSLRNTNCCLSLFSVPLMRTSDGRTSCQLLYITHWGQDKMADIFQTTFSSAFSWMKMYIFRLRFHWSFFLRVQLTIFQHWFRWWFGGGQAKRHYLNQCWLVYWRIYASLDLNDLNNCALTPVRTFTRAVRFEDNLSSFNWRISSFQLNVTQLPRIKRGHWDIIILDDQIIWAWRRAYACDVPNI